MTKMRNFDSTDPSLLETAAHDHIVTAYAVVYAMEAKLWTIAHDFDAWEDPNVRVVRDKVVARLKAIRSLYNTRFPWKCHSYSIRGNFSENYYGDLHNHDVDHALKKEFGESVFCDSESGWFVVDVTPTKVEEVKEFIKINFPDMEFTVDKLDENELNIPGVSNWLSANLWLKEREITVDMEFPKIQPKTGKELEKLLMMARKALHKTGLPKEEAIKLL